MTTAAVRESYVQHLEQEIGSGGRIRSTATPGDEGSYGSGDRIGSAGDETGDTPGDM